MKTKSTHPLALPTVSWNEERTAWLVAVARAERTKAPTLCSRKLPRSPR